MSYDRRLSELNKSLPPPFSQSVNNEDRLNSTVKNMELELAAMNRKISDQELKIRHLNSRVR